LFPRTASRRRTAPTYTARRKRWPLAGLHDSPIKQKIAIQKLDFRLSKEHQYMKYTAMVDDNFHYMDEEKRYKLGEYETMDAAIQACQTLIDVYLKGIYEPGATAEKMFEHYTSFGEDPFILGAQTDRREGAPFSAWDYAKKRCEEICSAGGK
jgi:hypothetical protein